jgi:inner membrane protein
MLLFTHLLTGLLSLKLLGWLNPLNALLVVIGSAVPDFDKKMGLKHRTITHSLAFLIPCFLIPSLGLGVGLHILLDLLTPTGTQLLYPRKDWFIILGAPLRTGKQDTLLSLLMIGGLIL